MTRSAILCEHANEVPMSCRCPEDCYCFEHTCKDMPDYLRTGRRPKHVPYLAARGTPKYPGDSLKTDAKPSSLYWLASGRVVDILRPRPDDIDFSDIANGLARVQRFGGQINAEHYSVAEHSVLVSRLCLPHNAILGLLHDASEAYIGDCVTPLKRQIPTYYTIEERWMLAIGRAAGLGERLAHLPIDVKVADTRALQTERRDLYSPPRRDDSGIEASPIRLKGLRPRDAEKQFRARFRELTGVRL